MSKKSELLHFYDNYNNLIEEIEKEDEFSNKFYEAFLSGDNELYQKYISETKIFDEHWIKTVESYVPSLNKIVNNPPSTIKVEEEIVAIEKAKKITSQSVKHLASHSHMIREVKSDGTVMPRNILTSYTDIDYGTYENRFIMTLIDRLFIFVRRRYEIIRDNVESYEKRRFNLKSEFPFNETKVELEMNFTLIDETEDKEINEFNKSLLKRVEYLNKVVTSLRGSQFMELMKEERKIHPPIMKTNVILKNVDFRNAYLLWLFLDRYNTLAFTTEVEEKDLTFTDDYYDAINRQVLTMYSSIVANQEMNKKEYETLKSKKYRKKSIKIVRKHRDDILVTPEDEMVEDQTLNEYYLNANKEIFKQSLDYHLEQVATYETGVKRALRDTLNISNALYESFFELDEEDDIFSRLITDIDVSKELAETRRKVLISKMIREVKAVDFNNSLRQEKSFLDDIVKYNDLLLKEHEEKLKLGKESIFNVEKAEYDKKQALLAKEILDKQLEENRYLSREIDKHRVETNKQINAYQRELDDKFRIETRDYRREKRTHYNKLLRDYKTKHMPTRRVTNQRLKAEKDKLNKELVIQKESAIKDQTKRIKDGRTNIETHFNDILKRDQKNYLALVKNNRKNVKELDDRREEYRKQMNEFNRKLRQEERQILEEYRKEVTQERIKKSRELRQEHKIDTRVTDNRLRQELRRLNRREKEQKERALKRQQERIAKEKEKIAKQSQSQIDKLEQDLIERNKQNKKNIKTLEEAKKDYEKTIKSLK